MVLRAFWESLGLVLGALGGFLGALLVVLGASWELQVATKLLSQRLWRSLWLIFGVFVVLLLDSSASNRFEVVLDLLLGPLFSHLRASGGGF